MSLEAIEVEARRFRRPWYWPALLLLAALAASWLLVANARSRVAESETAFRSAEQVRLQNVAIEINDYFSKADQLAATGALVFAPVHGDVATARRLNSSLFASRLVPESIVTGVGAFYAPYQFDPKVRLFLVYDTIEDGRLERESQRPNDPDYTTYPWYQRAVNARGRMVWEGPYFELRRSYISALKAFYRDGRLAGVMAVDTLTLLFKKMISKPLAAGDILWIESSTPGRHILSTQPIPSDLRRFVEIQTPLRYTGARIHLLADATPLANANAKIVQVAGAGIAVLWFLAIVSVLVLRQNWRAREASIALELRQARLQHEIEVSKTVEGELRKAAYTDALTGLPSRTPFMERLSEAIEARKAGKPHSVFFIDLDRFNKVNDILGHAAGDEMLRTIAERLRRAVPNDAMVARLGGDEFIVVAPVDDAGTPALAEAMLAALREPVTVGGRHFYSAASIGVVTVEPEHARADDLLRDADIAMYQAKRAGRDRYATFDTAMRAMVSQETDFEDALRHAIERFEFVPYYQPIVDLGTDTVVSFEALARWDRPNHGLLEAGAFIAFAEQHGLIDAIDAQVFDTVCRDAATLERRFPNAPIAVNLSANYLADPNLTERIVATLSKYGVSPSRVKLEITETGVMSNAVHAKTTLEALRDAGLEIVLDDFGQGHSSLAYLKHLPIRGLKIDRMFVEPLGREPQAIAIVRSIVALAQTLGLYSVAEGVETREQRDALGEIGALYAQGYYFARPSDLQTLMREVLA